MPYENDRKYFILGKPFIYDEEALEAGFTPIEIIALDFPTELYSSLVFKSNFDILQEVDTLPKLKIYTRNPYNLSYNISHELSSSILEEALGTYSKISEVFQALNLSGALDAFTKNLISRIVGDEGGTAAIIAETLRRRLIGYSGAFPKIWRGSNVDYSLKLEIVHAIYSYRDPKEEYKNLLSIIGKYTFPRSGVGKESDAAHESSPKLKGERTEGGKIADRFESSFLYELMYKFPYFVRVVNNKTGGIIIFAGMITNCTIEANSNNFLFSGIPAEVFISLEINPILPILLNASDSKYKFYTIDGWSEELSKTKSGVDFSTEKVMEKLSVSGGKSFRFSFKRD